MWIANRWEEYSVIDCSNGEKLERWGDYILLRPDPQVIWNTKRSRPEWKHLNAHYHRSKRGGGEWEFFDLPQQWSISYQLPLIFPKEDTNKKDSFLPADYYNGSGLLTFQLKPFHFKHTGLFPEQATNWDWFTSLIINRRKCNPNQTVKVLNLFAYTGGATIAAANAGAHVTHVDASKGMVGWAKENAISSGLSDAPIRWIVDDCKKFVEREIRRGNHYDAILMDPPSYGRGPKGELWKIEDAVFPLIVLCEQLLSDNPLFFLVNSYTTGLQPTVLQYMMGTALKKYPGTIAADEITLPVASNGLYLPCGASGRFKGEA